MAILCQKKFFDTFAKIPDTPEDAVYLGKLIAGVPEEKKPEAEKSFYDTLRIMKAKKPQEIADIPLADILKCFEYQNIFNEMFQRNKGGAYMDSFKRGFETQKNYRVYRIL